MLLIVHCFYLVNQLLFVFSLYPPPQKKKLLSVKDCLKKKRY